MKQLEEIAQEINRLRDYLIAINEEAGERVISSISIDTFDSKVSKPSVYVRRTLRDKIVNSKDVEKEDSGLGKIKYSITVGGVEFWDLISKENEEAISDLKKRIKVLESELLKGNQHEIY